MIRFESTEIINFLASVRKYMQLRGGLSQKDLADRIGVGVSTMSRFLNQKTKELDEQLIAQMVATLEIPLHEVIDFVAEDSTNAFKKLVKFYQGDDSTDTAESTRATTQNEDEQMAEVLGRETTREQTSQNIRGVQVPFGEKENLQARTGTFKEKINRLSPRQKGFLTDFLDLDVEGRDLVVDIGNSLFRYFKQKNAEF